MTQRVTEAAVQRGVRNEPRCYLLQHVYLIASNVTL